MYISEAFIDALLGDSSPNSLCEGPVPICEQLQFVNEGLGTLFTKVGEWFTRYRPKDPEFVRLRDRKLLDSSRCDKQYTELKSTRYVDYKTKTDSDNDEWNTRVSYDGYVRRPEYETCMMLTEYRFLKDTIELIKKRKFTLCKGNMNVDGCQKWIVENLPEMEDELKFIKGMIESIGKDKGLKSLNILVS